MTFDTAFERSHPPNTIMDKDNEAIHSLLLEWGTTGNVDSFRRRVVEYITTVREETRKAAFRDAVQWAKKVENVKRCAARDASADDEFAAMRLAHEADGAKRVIETIEAAANDEGEQEKQTTERKGNNDVPV